MQRLQKLAAEISDVDQVPEVSADQPKQAPGRTRQRRDTSRKPIARKAATIHHPTLGTLKFEKWLGWRGRVNVRGAEVDLVIPEDGQERMDDLLGEACEALPFLEQHEPTLRAALAEEYLVECNTAWKDKNEPGISAQDFMENLTLIEIAPRYEEGEIFTEVSYESGLYVGDAALVVRLNKARKIVDISFDE